ncbi:MAG: AAA family ATPase [Cellulomonas iranensis]|uniref:RNA polymerase recycling motor ATPase HelR n=1 Tax=Cellulomonas iranensis TaxID=76862 RepID=UPI001B032A2A|nr:AAA family ATPase [Cellulomonas iranensis]
MNTPVTSPFALPATLSAKADPALVAQDAAHLAAVADALRAQLADARARLDDARRTPTRTGTAALERDQEVHRLTARVRLLRRFGPDVCLGRTVAADGTRTYVGRIGLTDVDGTRLLVDWPSPLAAPFFAATVAHPLGLVSRRRYRWSGGRVVDYWDEVLTPDAHADGVAPDDQSAFLASLGEDRSDRMRDVLTTIAADQDAAIRADARGTLGPGTGKTVVALHRAAYLLHADPHLARRGGVLVVGPHRPYLDYVADVLPSLGEDGVVTCTLRDLVPEGADARPEPDPRVAALKSTVAMVGAIEPAVAFSERPPTADLVVGTPWADVVLTAADWADAFASVEPGTPHDEARDQVWETLAALVVERHDADVPTAELRRALTRDRGLTRTFGRHWPLLDGPDVVADLWSVPAYLRLCAPWLTPDEVRALQRDDPHAWTDADLPLLDAARRRVGDPEAPRRARERDAAEAADREYMADVVDYLASNDDSELGLMKSLAQGDLREALVDHETVERPTPDRLAGPFAHVVVDEAQELTDAQWQMLLARCPSRSFTVVGDRAQARAGFVEPWVERLTRVGLRDVDVATLTVNYRTPAEVMAAAEPVIRAAVPDANVPTSIRATGVPVRHGAVADLDAVLDTWLAAHTAGVACVIGADATVERDRVRSLTPTLAKGLEFDLVVLVDPGAWGDDVAATVDRYVAMTRATSELVVLGAA